MGRIPRGQEGIGNKCSQVAKNGNLGKDVDKSSVSSWSSWIAKSEKVHAELHDAFLVYSAYGVRFTISSHVMCA